MFSASSPKAIQNFQAFLPTTKMFRSELGSLPSKEESLLDQRRLMELMRQASSQQRRDAEKYPDGMISVAGAKNHIMGDFLEKYYKQRIKDFDPSNCED